MNSGECIYVKKLLRSTLVLMILVVVSGCGTLFGRPDASFYPPAKYYKGTQYDVQVLFAGDEVNRGFSHATKWCWISLICPPVTIVSIPLDIIIDTAFVPHDMTL
jgi:uncharacterized protein YceK